jgi:hypothetical protein
MRFSWIEAEVLRAAREAILLEPDAEEDFTSTFELPPAPAGVSEQDWPRVAEHVARADRVSRFVAQEGLESARSVFAKSPHAVEIAALAASALEADELGIDLIEDLLCCAVDELVAYGSVLTLLVDIGSREDRERMVGVYERFCAVAEKRKPTTSTWKERVDGMRGGLASAYVMCDRCDDAHRIFESQHRNTTHNVYAALSASRTFLAAGEVARAADWLDVGAERARGLGRTAMEKKLREKSASLRNRLP